MRDFYYHCCYQCLLDAREVLPTIVDANGLSNARFMEAAVA